MEIQRSGGKCQGHRGTQSIFFFWLTSFHHLHEWWGLSVRYRVPGQKRAPGVKNGRGQLLNRGLHFEPRRSGAASLTPSLRAQGTSNSSRLCGQRDEAPRLCLSLENGKFLHLATGIYGAPTAYQRPRHINTCGLKLHWALPASRHGRAFHASISSSQSSYGISLSLQCGKSGTVMSHNTHQSCSKEGQRLSFKLWSYKYQCPCCSMLEIDPVEMSCESQGDVGSSPGTSPLLRWEPGAAPFPPWASVFPSLFPIFLSL